MVVILLHICTHHDRGVSSGSHYVAHKPRGFLAPFALRSCYGIAIDDYFDCSYIHINSYLTCLCYGNKDIWILICKQNEGEFLWLLKRNASWNRSNLAGIPQKHCKSQLCWKAGKTIQKVVVVGIQNKFTSYVV